MPAEPLSQLSLALDVTGRVIAAVGDRQWADRTPCTEWSVSDLVRHLVAGSNWFATAVSGEPRPDADEAAPRDDLAEAEVAFSLGKLGDIPPGRTPFALPQAVDPDAPAIDRLAACLGRDVGAHAGPPRTDP
jgi:hypothetical protein